MLISSSGLVYERLHISSYISELPNQSIKSKQLLKNGVSNFLQNHISRTLHRNAYMTKLKYATSNKLGKTVTVTEVLDLKPDRESSGGDDGNGNFPPGNGRNGGDGGNEDDHDEKESGSLMKIEEVMKVAEKQGVSLPSDMIEAAKATGLRKLNLTRYMDLQLVIDSCCATFAEVQKRGKDFWAELELYAADRLVGIVVDIALFGMLAPYARIGKQTIASGGLFSGLNYSIAALPGSVFEFERPGCIFSAQERLATYFYKGILNGSVGFGCGIIGQGIANMIMHAKRYAVT